MEDEKIVQLYWDRNEQAILETSEKYGAYCMSIAKNIIKNQEDAQEIVNDTYLNTWNCIPPQKPNVLSTFLGKITRNLSFNKFKYNNSEKRGGGQLTLILDELEECVSNTKRIDEEIEEKELIKAIEDFIDALSYNKRNIFICRYWYTESISKIAKRFRMKESAVSMSLKRIREKLNAYLLERGF